MSAETEAIGSVPPSTILVVDDSATNLQVLVRTLHGSGHRILVAKDGPTALEIARRGTPDLVLLDVMMPVMDGFEVCRQLKAQPETRNAAVIFLSARGEVSDKVSGLELGAVDYITKPIQAEEVLARVAAHLSRQHLEHALRDRRVLAVVDQRQVHGFERARGARRSDRELELAQHALENPQIRAIGDDADLQGGRQHGGGVYPVRRAMRGCRVARVRRDC